MYSQLWQRVLNELCALIGFKDIDAFSEGAKLRIDANIVTFVYDDVIAADKIAIFVDMGKTRKNDLAALESLMKLNFSLGACERGVLSLHPVTSHVFYSFHYSLHSNASGQQLLDTLIRTIGDVGLDAQAMCELEELEKV